MNDLISKRDPLAFNWLIASGSLALAPHLFRLPIWVSLVFVASVAWRWLANQRTWYVPGSIVRLLITALFCMAVFKDYGTLLGRDAGTGLLVGLAGLKFLELRNLRDYSIVIFIFYLLVGVNFLYEQSLLHGLYLIAAVFATTATLVRINLPKSGSWQTSLRLAGSMMLKAVPLMLVFYLFFPRIQGGLWGLPADAHSGLSGLSSEINPGSISQLAQSEAPAFRVEFKGAVPGNRDRYWRALVLSENVGRRWKQAVMPYLDDKAIRLALADSGAKTRYTVTLEPSNKLWMPALDIPVTAPQGSRLKSGYLLEAVSPQNSRSRYTVESGSHYPYSNLSAQERKRELQIDNLKSARVRELVQQWKNSSDTPQAVVNKALQYFHNNDFRYTLTPPLLGNQPVDEFMFETRSGFCEHYATTFVSLMRLAGIPSRVVLGYQGGDFNENGDYLIVRQSDAHAWTEVWLEHKGWTRVDPTAAIAPERIELGIDAIRRLEQQGLRPGTLSSDALRNLAKLGFLEQFARQSRLAWDAVNLAWFRWTTGYDLKSQMALLQRLGLEAPGWLGLIFGMTAGLGIFVVLIVGLLRRSEHDVDPIQKIYRQFEKRLGDGGLKRLPHEGAVDFANRVASIEPALATKTRDITELYVQLRYNPDEDNLHRERLVSLRHQVDAFRPKRLLADAES